MKMKMRTRQGGVVILESLIAIMLFSIGILALIAMFTGSITMSADAQYRSEATHYANQLMNEIWVGVNHSAPPAALTDQVETFAFNQTVNGDCSFSGGGVANATLDDWVARVTAAAGLPGTEASHVQVLVNGAAFNQVTITICWRTPGEAPTAPMRRHVLVGNVT